MDPEQGDLMLDSSSNDLSEAEPVMAMWSTSGFKWPSDGGTLKACKEGLKVLICNIEEYGKEQLQPRNHKFDHNYLKEAKGENQIKKAFREVLDHLHEHPLCRKNDENIFQWCVMGFLQEVREVQAQAWERLHDIEGRFGKWIYNQIALLKADGAATSIGQGSGNSGASDQDGGGAGLSVAKRPRGRPPKRKEVLSVASPRFAAVLAANKARKSSQPPASFNDRNVKCTALSGGRRAFTSELQPDGSCSPKFCASPVPSPPFPSQMDPSPQVETSESPEERYDRAMLNALQINSKIKKNKQRLLDAHNDMQKSLACGEFDFQNLLRIVKDLDENLASKINLGPSLACCLYLKMQTSKPEKIREKVKRFQEMAAQATDAAKTCQEIQRRMQELFDHACDATETQLKWKDEYGTAKSQLETLQSGLLELCKSL